MSFVTLAEVKTYFGVVDNTYDPFLQEQLDVVCGACEMYCGRKFEADDYTQVFYRDEIDKDLVKELYLYHFPVNSIASIQDENGEDILEYRAIFSTGLLRRKYNFFCGYEELTVQYNAGYSSIPPVLKSVVFSLVGENYNKKVAGVDVSFGIDVQRISIPGTISIDYDYTLSNNESSKALGTILKNQTNVLDQFRSERSVMGVVREGYVY